jgi:hypothetical protein
VESWDKPPEDGVRVRPDGLPGQDDVSDSTFEESGYDAEGRRTSSKDRGGRTTGYQYDHWPTPDDLPDASFTENAYDAAGRLVTTKDARGYVTTYEYDGRSANEGKDALNQDGLHLRRGGEPEDGHRRPGNTIHTSTTP